jgi:hypothetical protein
MSANTIEHIAWCRMLFHSLKDGGVWGIPRTGVMFQRAGDQLVFSDRLTMQYDSEMPLTKDEFDEQQAREIEDVREHFGAAGIAVVVR